MPFIKKTDIPKPAPKVYFVQDQYANNYRLGRSDNPGDYFIIITNEDFVASKSSSLPAIGGLSVAGSGEGGRA